VRRIRVQCPCCHGRGYLVLHEEFEDFENVTRHECVHCNSEGEVEAEQQ